MHGDLSRAQQQLSQRVTLSTPGTGTNAFHSRSSHRKSSRVHKTEKNRFASILDADCHSLSEHVRCRRFSLGARYSKILKRVNQSNEYTTISKGQRLRSPTGLINLVIPGTESRPKDPNDMKQSCCSSADVSFLADKEHEMQELDFNVNAVHKSRSEEHHEVCKDVSGGCEVAGMPTLFNENDESVTSSGKTPTLMFSSGGEVEELDGTISDGTDFNLFPASRVPCITEWFQEKLNTMLATLPSRRSYLGVHIYIIVAIIFVLWTKFGLARSVFEHLLDALIQVVLLTLLMTTTVVVFEANDMTVKIVSMYDKAASALKTLVSEMHLVHHEENKASLCSHACGQTSWQVDTPIRVTSPDEPVTTYKEAIHENTENSLHSQQTSLQTHAETMTEALSLGASSQTDAILDAEGNEVAFYTLADVAGYPSDVQVLDAESQTELDVRTIYEQTEKNKKSHAKSLRNLQRKFLAIRRSCQKKVRDMKQQDISKGDYLAKLQLQLPALRQEKNTLVAERAMVEKQFADEKKKNRDLMNRMTRLNQQFYHLGQSYSSMPAWRQQLKTNNLNCYRFPSEQHSLHQNPFVPGGQQNTKLQQPRQLKLAQLQCNAATTVVLHGKQMNNAQQPYNKAVQSTQLSAAQQQRLPIFQLLQNSLLTNRPTATGFHCQQQVPSQANNLTSGHQIQQLSTSFSNTDPGNKTNSSHDKKNMSEGSNNQ